MEPLRSIIRVSPKPDTVQCTSNSIMVLIRLHRYVDLSRSALFVYELMSFFHLIPISLHYENTLIQIY